MSRKSKLTIAFPRGGSIPKGVLNADEDQRFGPGEPVSVPADYGQHLIDEKFAVEAKTTAAKKQKTSKPQTNTSPTVDIDALKSAVADAEKALEEAADDEAKVVAEKALEDAREKLAAVEGA